VFEHLHVVETVQTTKFQPLDNERQICRSNCLAAREIPLLKEISNIQR